MHATSNIACKAVRRAPHLGTLGLAVASAVGLWAGPAFGQAQPGGAQPGAAQPAQPGQTPPQPGSDEERRQRFEQFRKSAEDRMKVLLEAKDEEYEILKPRIEKIQQMQQANDPRRVGIGMLMNSSSWRSRATTPGEGQRAAAEGAARPQGNPPQQQRWSPFGNVVDTASTQKARDLQEALESKGTSDDTLKGRLAALRQAKLQAKQEMAQAQEDLRQLCSIRQEAVLALMGILE